MPLIYCTLHPTFHKLVTLLSCLYGFLRQNCEKCHEFQQSTSVGWIFSERINDIVTFFRIFSQVLFSRVVVHLITRDVFVMMFHVECGLHNNSQVSGRPNLLRVQLIQLSSLHFRRIRILDFFLRIIWKFQRIRSRDRTVRWPSNNEKIINENFFSINGVLNLFGSLTTIPVKKVTKNGWMTVNKKTKRHAILLKLLMMVSIITESLNHTTIYF